MIFEINAWANGANFSGFRGVNWEKANVVTGAAPVAWLGCATSWEWGDLTQGAADIFS